VFAQLALDVSDAPAAAVSDPELLREGLDLVLVWPNGIRFALTSIRDGRDGVRGELSVARDGRRLHWGTFALASTQAREALRKKLEAAAPGLPWVDMLEDVAYRLTQAARQGEPLVTLTGRPSSPTRDLLPHLLYEGEVTALIADGDTGKSLAALTIAAAVQSGIALPFGLRPARAVPVAYLDWETSRDTIEERLAMIAAGLGIDPPPIVYRRMSRPLVDEASALAAEFARRSIGALVVDSKMFAVAGGDGAAFHEPITAFYNALRLFAPAASLVLNHITNADARAGGSARPFGGAFAFNGPRLIWEAKRDREITDATAIAFYLHQGEQPAAQAGAVRTAVRAGRRDHHRVPVRSDRSDAECFGRRQQDVQGAARACPGCRDAGSHRGADRRGRGDGEAPAPASTEGWQGARGGGRGMGARLVSLGRGHFVRLSADTLSAHARRESFDSPRGGRTLSVYRGCPFVRLHRSGQDGARSAANRQATRAVQDALPAQRPGGDQPAVMEITPA